jgi:hypothetical protein
MREDAWPTRLELFAPYGGITRFRFKGSSDRSDLSAIGSPALPQNRSAWGEVNVGCRGRRSDSETKCIASPLPRLTARAAI